MNCTAIRVGFLFACVGCGGVRTDYSKVDLANVRGTVKLEGRSLADAVVLFEAPDQTYSFATTDDAGRYRLLFNSEKPGAMPGPKVVRIRTSGGLEEAEETEEEDEPNRAATAKELVPSCYNSQSKLRLTVASGSQRFDFDLKLDCSFSVPDG